MISTPSRARARVRPLLLLAIVAALFAQTAARSAVEPKAAPVAGGAFERDADHVRVIIWDGVDETFLSRLRAVSDFKIVYRYRSIEGVALKIRASAQAAALAFAQQNGLQAEPEVFYQTDLNASTRTIRVKGTSAGGSGEAWDLANGSGVSIAVLDTGMYGGHPSLNDQDLTTPGQQKIVHFRDYVNNAGNPTAAFDDQGHGSHTSGIAAGTGESSAGGGPQGRGNVGVAYGASLVGLKVLDENGTASSTNTVAAIDWMALNGNSINPPIRVANYSIGPIVQSPGSNNGSGANAQAMNRAVQAGIVFVQSGGNGDSDGLLPNQQEGNVGGDARLTIAVCSSNSAAPPTAPTYSNWDSEGPTADGRPKPEVCAPGDAVAAPDWDTNGYVTQGGTSMSSPHVAGVAALIIQAVPSITPAQVKKVIIQTALNYSGSAPYDEFTPHNGWNGDRGWGEVNAKAAVLRAIADYGGNNPLSLNTGGPYTVIQGESRQLLAGASYGRPPYTFSWDLDNNGSFETSGAGATFSNTATPGTRTVNVKVVDSASTPATVTASTVVDVLAAQSVFSDTVEGGANGWVSDETTGWHIQTAYSQSPTSSWYAGTDVVEQYPPLADFTLTRTFNLATAPASTSGQLLFKFARSGASEQDFDYLRAEIKKTSDTAWTTLGQWSGSTGNAWMTEAFDITAFRGFSTDIRFRFTSDDSVLDRGWFVDDIKIIGSVANTDTTAPNPVVLSAGSPTLTSATVSWNATGDDGNTGLAASYDLRYATTPITPATFALAPQASGLPSPAAPGTAQSTVVSGLNPNTTYYFAMKVGDEASNFSTMSNVASATTLPDVTPPTVPTLSGVAGNAAANLTWSASTDNVAVDKYEVFKDGVLATTVNHPTTAVTIGGLTNGTTYGFTVRAKDTGGLYSGLSNTVNLTPVSPPAIDGWPEARGGSARTGATSGRGSLSVPAVRQTISAGTQAINASPLIADITGDGLDDVVVVGKPGVNIPATVRAYRQTASGLVAAWTYDVPMLAGQNDGSANLALGQLNGGGPLELAVYSNNVISTPAVTSNQGRLAVLNASTGALIDDLSVDAASAEALVIGVDAPPAIGDVTGDGVAEIVLIHHVGGTAPGSFLASYVLTGGVLAEQFDTNLTATSNWRTWALAEIRADHDGLEVVAGQSVDNAVGAVRLCTPSGSGAACGENVATTTGVMGVSVADLTGDGIAEIVANGRTGSSLNVIRTSPSLSRISQADGTLWNTASLGNVDTTTGADIINIQYSTFADNVDKAGTVTVRGFNGSAIVNKGTLARVPAPGGNYQSQGGGALADIAGDTRPELIYGQADGTLTAVKFAADGTPTLLWNVALPAAANGPVAVGDVTGDELLDVVVATADGSVRILGAGPLASITITPATASIVAGGSKTYAVEGFDAAGNSLGNVTGATTLSISGGGSCTGATCTSTVAGNHTVTATHAGKTATATLTVTPGPIFTLAISPPSSSVAAGQSQVYTTTGADQYGNSTGDATALSTFTIAPSGTCTANSCKDTVSGVHTVTAQAGAATVDAALTVNPGPLTSLVLLPAETTVVLGNSQTYTAQGRDAFGNSLGDLTAGTNFSIVPNGSCSGAVCTPAAVGDHTVRAARGTAQGSAIMHVIPESIYRVVISPNPATITAGGSQTFTAEGFDANNVSVGDVTPVTVFTIGPNGSCTANACTATVAGPHTVVGSVSGTAGTAQLNVVAGPLASITISPAISSIPSGGFRTYAVQGRDQYNNVTGDVTGSATFAIAPDGTCTDNVCTASVFGQHTVTATVGTATATATLNVVPPAPAIITPAAGSLNPASIQVTGTAAPGTTVTLWDNGSKIAGNVPVAADGSWSVTASFGHGNHTMTAFAASGQHVSAPSAARSFRVDANAPTTVILKKQGYVLVQIYHPLEAPIVEGVARDADSGVAAVEVTYTPLTAGSEIVDTVRCAGPCSEFRWSSNQNLLPGIYEVTAVPIDAAGNRGAAASMFIVTTSIVGG